MNRYGKAFIAFIICVSIAIPCLSGFNFSASLADFSEEKYISDVTDMYRKYDTNLAERDKNDPLALNRLVVSDYNGKLYGAVERAWDKKHKLGLLQYETRADAEKAQKIIRSEGLVAEGDAISELIGDEITDIPTGTPLSIESTPESEKGNINPRGSNFLGTSQYINKLNPSDEEIIVAIVDTGVMYDHTAIADRFYSTGVDLSADKAFDAYYDTEMSGQYYGHATMVSGIIADNTPNNVKILPYKAVAFGESYAEASNIVIGINNAVDAGAKVINISLSTSGCYEYFERAIANARSKGVCVCASAGNNSMEVTDRYPACSTYAFTISALESDFQTLASFSNYGGAIDFTAPGRYIRSTSPVNGESGFKNGSGTSFSSPYVAACCACIKCEDKNMARDEVYQVLRDFVQDIGDEGYDFSFGYGAPYLGDMEYTDGENYSFRIPENELEIYNSVDYTADTQPWKRFAHLITDVTVDRSIDRIGNYAFYNMPNAEFHMKPVYDKIGEYAFYGCTQFDSYTCTINVSEIGHGAFLGIDNFTLNGYRNTPAESYAVSDGVTFNAIGCKHNYRHVVYDPTKTSEGYTLYTCLICGDQYVGAYIEPTPVATGACGDNLTYTYYDTGRLTIDGTGDMYDYMNTPAPWENYKNDIAVIQIKKNVGDISPFAFYGCTGITKLFISDDCVNYYDDEDKNLIRKSDNKLIFTLVNSQNESFTLPERAESFDASAFVLNTPSSVSGNGYYTKDALVYDENGNIVLALKGYNQNELNPTKNIHINDFAFIYTQYPVKVTSDLLGVTVGEYALGYYYDGTMNKHDTLFVTNSESAIYTYAVENGFDIDTGITGRCGDDIIWRYDATYFKLTLCGSGDMYVYDDRASVPWYQYMSNVRIVVIDDSITSLSPYSFYNATMLSTLTLPLSIQAPHDINTWNGCTAIKTINLTLGTGRTDVYDDGTNNYYTYTPWYLSRSSITSFNLDENVKYITKDAFRACSCIKSLTFNCVEKIERHAFVACTGLTEITNYCKTTEYEDYCLFSYQFGTASGGYYSNKTIHGYSDSTSKDFCETTGGKVLFDSIGCDHSRNTEYSREEAVDDYITNTLYYCSDCGEEYVYDVTDLGSTVNLSLHNKRGIALENAEIYVDGELFGTTDSMGRVSSRLLQGTYPLELKLHGITVFEAELNADKNTVNAEIKIQYANYVNDGAINAKDYAYALKNGFNDKELFDYGKINTNYNRIIYNEN